MPPSDVFGPPDRASLGACGAVGGAERVEARPAPRSRPAGGLAPRPLAAAPCVLNIAGSVPRLSRSACARATRRALSSSSEGIAASIAHIAALRDSAAEGAARRPALGAGAAPCLARPRLRMGCCESSAKLGSGPAGGGAAAADPLDGCTARREAARGGGPPRPLPLPLARGLVTASSIMPSSSRCSSRASSAAARANAAAASSSIEPRGRRPLSPRALQGGAQSL